MPGTKTVFSGVQSSVQELVRTPMASRPNGGGVYVAYTGGYPSETKLLAGGGKVALAEEYLYAAPSLRHFSCRCCEGRKIGLMRMFPARTLGAADGRGPVSRPPR